MLLENKTVRDLWMGESISGAVARPSPTSPAGRSPAI
jgi:hypothetical protein